MFNLLRKPFPMSDEELIEQALELVHTGKDINEYVKGAENALEHVWRNVRETGLVLTPSQEKELKRISDRVRPRLQERARQLAIENMKRQTVESINKIRYEALLTAELSSRGFTFSFAWQKKAVQVTVKLSETLACTHEIKYSAIERGRLPVLIGEISHAVELLGGQDLKVSIWRLSDYWNQRTEWKH